MKAPKPQWPSTRSVGRIPQHSLAAFRSNEALISIHAAAGKLWRLSKAFGGELRSRPAGRPPAASRPPRANWTASAKLLVPAIEPALVTRAHGGGRLGAAGRKRLRSQALGRAAKLLWRAAAAKAPPGGRLSANSIRPLVGSRRRSLAGGRASGPAASPSAAAGTIPRHANKWSFASIASRTIPANGPGGERVRATNRAADFAFAPSPPPTSRAATYNRARQ